MAIAVTRRPPPHWVRVLLAPEVLSGREGDETEGGREQTGKCRHPQGDLLERGALLCAGMCRVLSYEEEDTVFVHAWIVVCRG